MLYIFVRSHELKTYAQKVFMHMFLIKLYQSKKSKMLLIAYAT